MHLYKLLLSTGVLLSLMTLSATAETEKTYADRYCEDGVREQRLNQGRTYVKVDCLTASHALEVEFAHKWPEAIGQALNYAQLARPRSAGIILVCQKTSTCTTHGLRLTTTIKNFRLPISVWYCLPTDQTIHDCAADPAGIPFRSLEEQDGGS